MTGQHFFQALNIPEKFQKCSEKLSISGRLDTMSRRLAELVYIWEILSLIRGIALAVWVILDKPARVRSSRKVKHLVNNGRTQTSMNPQGLFLNIGIGNSSWNMHDMVIDS